MRARARLTVGPGRRVPHMVEDPPVAFRRTPDAVYLVGTAGGPAGDDGVEVDVDVLPGGALTLRSTAATVVYAGTGTSHAVRLRAGAGALVDWEPEPVIVTAGARHRQTAAVELAADAALAWTEVVLLGRHAEAPGRADLRLDVTVGGRALLRHELALGPGAAGWDGPAVLGPHRAVGLRLLAGTAAPAGEAPPPGARSAPTPPPGPAPPGGASSGVCWAWLRLDGPGWLLTVVGDDLPAVRAVLDARVSPTDPVRDRVVVAAPGREGGTPTRGGPPWPR